MEESILAIRKNEIRRIRSDICSAASQLIRHPGRKETVVGQIEWSVLHEPKQVNYNINYLWNTVGAPSVFMLETATNQSHFLIEKRKKLSVMLPSG